MGTEDCHNCVLHSLRSCRRVETTFVLDSVHGQTDVEIYTQPAVIINKTKIKSQLVDVEEFVDVLSRSK